MSDLLDRLKTALADRYAIERELGAGGMATVYLAEDIKHHRPVAVKVLRPELAAVLGAERFLREIEVTARLTHPHILTLLDSGEADGFLYYVMPFVEGESLRDKLNSEKQLPLDDALQFAREVADALSYAHSHDVVHRDIKPENILLEAGHAVIADFGIARAVTAAGGEALTETGVSIGTPAYMSPEQCEGSSDIDGRSDIYSLGSVLYELLAGEPPYTGPTAQAIIAKRLSEPVPHVSTLRETVPPTVEAAINKALAKAPADRFTTATQLRDALTASTALPGVSVKRRRRVGQAAAIALAVVLFVAGSRWAFNTFGSGADRIAWLAVLPPDNLTGDSAQEYFVAGMHGELISKLNQIPGLDVISRTSAVRYRDTDKSIPQIARELNVDAVIESSVWRSGDSVRIQVQLIEAFPRERHLWNDTYDRAIEDVLALHSAVALDVAGQIQATLMLQDEARLAEAADVRLASTRPVNPAVYDAYLRGRFISNRRDPRGYQRAFEYFNEALTLDSGYAPAYSGLADVYNLLGIYGALASNQAFPKASEQALKALQIDDGLAEAHSSLGLAREMGDWDWQGAEESFREAIRLNDGYAPAHQWYGQFLVYMGRTEQGLAELRRAVALDPFGPPNVGLGLGLYFARWYDDAIAQLRRAIELSGPNPILHVSLAWTYLQKAMPAEAIAVVQQADSLFPRNQWVLLALATVHAEGGARDEAVKVLQELMELSSGGVPPHSVIAAVHAVLGEHDEAMDWLERAYDLGEYELVYLKVQPEFDPLRQDPRFQDLMRRMNFPE